MRKLTVFNQVSLDGYICDRSGDMSWAHQNDPEWNAFVGDNAASDGVLVYGRVTYEMMAGFWPTAMAKKAMPAVAKGINAASKIVFSTTLKKAAWNNTTVLKGNLLGEIKKLKKAKGGDLVIMGSGSLIPPLADAGLIDEYQLVVNPVALGAGKTMFEGLSPRLALRRVSTRAFENGNLLLTYAKA